MATLRDRLIAYHLQLNDLEQIREKIPRDLVEELEEWQSLSPQDFCYRVGNRGLTTLLEGCSYYDVIRGAVDSSQYPIIRHILNTTPEKSVLDEGLGRSVMRNNDIAVNMFLSAGATPQAGLRSALENANRRFLTFFLESNPPLVDHAMVVNAAKSGDLEFFKEINKQYPNSNPRLLPFIIGNAVISGNVDLVDYIIGYATRGEALDTALQNAIVYNRRKILDYLLDKATGVDWDALVTKAFRYGNWELYRELFRRAVTNGYNSWHRTFDVALIDDNIEVIKDILSTGWRPRELYSYEISSVPILLYLEEREIPINYKRTFAGAANNDDYDLMLFLVKERGVIPPFNTLLDLGSHNLFLLELIPFLNFDEDDLIVLAETAEEEGNKELEKALDDMLLVKKYDNLLILAETAEEERVMELLKGEKYPVDERLLHILAQRHFNQALNLIGGLPPLI